MRRRLDLAASLITRPPLIFLDEPTTGLDPRTRGQMWDTIRDLVTNGCTVLLTTQYLDEADQLADRIAVIDHGRVIAHDTAQGLKRQLGGQTLEVRPVSLGDLARVEELLAGVGTRPPERPAPDLVSVPVADETALTRVVAALAAESIGVTELSLRLPSLDEVFYALTGRPVHDDAEEVTA
jgi:oleandomycin transport system ATP-binding protein